MNITGHTTKEAFAICRKEGLDISFNTVISAFSKAVRVAQGEKKGWAPLLDVTVLEGKLRVCTEESFAVWLKYQKDRRAAKRNRKKLAS